MIKSSVSLNFLLNGYGFSPTLCIYAGVIIACSWELKRGVRTCKSRYVRYICLGCERSDYGPPTSNSLMASELNLSSLTRKVLS